MSPSDRERTVVLGWDERKRLFERLIDEHVPAEARVLFRKALAEQDRRAAAPAPLGPVPRVSCILVTKNAIELVARSLDDYARQTHPAKELVIVLDPRSPRAAIAAHVAALGLADVRVLEAPPRAKLGALRNLAHAAASGDVLCQWDDDDRHHPERLAVQLGELVRHDAQACFLQETLHLVGADLSWSDWAQAPFRCHPGTLMVRRAGAPDYVGWATFSEDVFFFCALAGQVALVRGRPELFVYVHHGANSWDERHHRELAAGLALPVAELGRERARLRAALRTLRLAGALRLVGRDGVLDPLEPG